MLKRTQDYTARSAINSTANCVEQASYQKTQRRRTKADGYHLYPALTPVSDQGRRRINSHGKERHCAQCYRQNNGWRHRGCLRLTPTFIPDLLGGRRAISRPDPSTVVSELIGLVGILSNRVFEKLTRESFGNPPTGRTGRIARVSARQT